MLHDSDATSLEFVKRMMLGQMPLIPDIAFPICDVRDVAEAHVRAMVLFDTVNNRHIIASERESKGLIEIAKMLQDEFKPKNYKISTCKAPSLVVRFGSWFDKTVAQVNNQNFVLA